MTACILRLADISTCVYLMCLQILSASLNDPNTSKVEIEKLRAQKRTLIERKQAARKAQAVAGVLPPQRGAIVVGWVRGLCLACVVVGFVSSV